MVGPDDGHGAALRLQRVAVDVLAGLIPAAQAGDRRACWEAGEIWLHFLGVPLVAASWYRRAAAAGCGRAAMRLAELHCYGRGCMRDPEEAMFWCVVAEAWRCPGAQARYRDIRAQLDARGLMRVQERLVRRSSLLLAADGSSQDA